MKRESLIKSLALVFLLLFSLMGCDHTAASSLCDQTERNFIRYFNTAEYHKIPSLFQKDSKTKSQFNKLAKDLDYIKTVVGKIKSMKVTTVSGNKVNYISTHEIAAMEISFLFNEQCQITSLLIKNHFPEDLPELERNKTSMNLPFHGEWYVFWGGTTIKDNYHNAHQNMKGAFDFLVYDDQGKSYRTNGKKNEDYYAFGKEIIAPCDAEVVKVITGVKDNVWPKMNQVQSYGNAVVLKTAQDEYLLFAHMKEHSLVVQEGEKVNRGDKLGLCGNSGYSTEPHLHFIVQNVADLFHPTGAFCYFENILVNGTSMQDYLPVRGERIQNINP